MNLGNLILGLGIGLLVVYAAGAFILWAINEADQLNSDYEGY